MFPELFFSFTFVHKLFILPILLIISSDIWNFEYFIIFVANEILWWRAMRHISSFWDRDFQEFVCPSFLLQYRRFDHRRQCSILGRCPNRVATGRCTSNTVRPCTLVTAGKNPTPFTLNLKQRAASVQNNMSMSYCFIDGYQVPVAPFNLTITTWGCLLGPQQPSSL